MQLFLTPTPDNETAAAITAAIAAVLEQEQHAGASELPARSAWNAAAALQAQGVPAVRNAAHTSWSAVERAQRAQRWSYGIIGL